MNQVNLHVHNSHKINLAHIMMTLKDYIQNYCTQRGISLSKLAKCANLPRSSLYNMMDQKNSTTLINLTKLAVAMQVHPQYLVKLEWQKYLLDGSIAQAVDPLPEPKLLFNNLADSSHFVSETIADGSLLATGETFVKTWRLQNTGNTAWVDRWLVCQNHDESIHQQASLQAFVNDRCFFITPKVDRVAVPNTQIGEIVDLSVELTAPNVPCRAFSYWKMTDDAGNLCFPDSIGVYAYVQVISAGGAGEKNVIS